MLLLLPVHWAGHKPVTFDPGKVLWLVERGQWQRFPLANPMWLICPPQLAAEQISATASPDEWKQFAKRWERHFNLLEASLLSEHKCVTAFLIGARAGLNLPGPYFFCSDIYCPKLSHFSLPEHTPKITKFGINLPKNVISIVVLNFHH